MKDGICPKCAAKEVRLFKNTPAELSINTGFFSAASVVYYICTECGYVELYVANKSELPEIAKKLPKV
ncbi:MAG TPA: hypothetical protein VIL74_15670 [Pyrinomonadaceae bacterium]|jgi:predicted nucleic-acid-binding Zn-ribbon protein